MSKGRKHAAPQVGTSRDARADELPELELGRYRVMPELTEEQYGALKESIRVHGVQVPVEVDEHFRVIDGEARVRACRELGITDFPVIIRLGMTEEEKRDHALRLNCQRRRPSRKQQRELIEAELIRDPARSNYVIAELCGSTPPTVRRNRIKLQEAGDIEAVDEVEGRDGLTQPARKSRTPSVIATNHEDAMDVLAVVPQIELATLSEGLHAADEIVSFAKTERQHRQRREAQIAEAELDGGAIDLFLADATADGDGPTDYVKLAKLAIRVLRPGAPLVVVVPKANLPVAMSALGSRLEWATLFVDVLDAERTVADPVPIEERCRLLLLFHKPGQSHERAPLPDLFNSDESDGPSAIESLIGAHTHPGDTVLDPTADADVTAVCEELGRRCVSVACPAILLQEQVTLMEPGARETNGSIPLADQAIDDASHGQLEAECEAAAVSGEVSVHAS